jgi:hypothetical protein
MTPKNGQFACIPASAAGARDLGAQDFRVLVALAAHADSEGRAYPSLARIASLTGVARKNVPRSIARLEKAGLLRHRQRKSETSAWGHNLYSVVFEEAGPVSEAEQSAALAIEQVIEQKGEAARAIAEGMLAVWRTECGDELPVPRSLDRDRMTACQARFRDSFGRNLDQWRALCREIRQSPFCCGAGERGWLADFDWALKPKSIRNVREGKYRNDRQPPRSRGNGTYNGIPPLGPGGT